MKGTKAKLRCVIEVNVTEIGSEIQGVELLLWPRLEERNLEAVNELCLPLCKDII